MVLKFATVTCPIEINGVTHCNEVTNSIPVWYNPVSVELSERS